MKRLSSHHETRERYFVLRLVGGGFTVLGCLLLAGSGVLLAFGLYVLLTVGAAPPAPDALPFAAHPAGLVGVFGRIGGVLWLVWSLALLVSGLQCVAFGALIRLAVHLEENTRAAAQSLEKLRLRTEPAGENAGSIFLS